MADFKTQNYLIAGNTEVTTTGTINALAHKGYSLLRMNNATDATINGIVAGYAGQELTIVSVGVGNVFFTHNSGSAAAADQINNNVTSGKTPLAAGFGFATYKYDAASSKWRLIQHCQGNWISVAYNSGDYTASSGTWTVDLADLFAFTYWLKDNTLLVSFSINTTSVSATPTTLQVAIPAGYTSTSDTRMPSFVQDNGATAAVGMARVVGGPGTVIFCYKDPAGSSWSSATNATSVNASLSFPVS